MLPGAQRTVTLPDLRCRFLDTTHDNHGTGVLQDAPTKTSITICGLEHDCFFFEGVCHTPLPAPRMVELWPELIFYLLVNLDGDYPSEDFGMWISH